uniref:Uncharacterized protein n=1 Tax=Tanacetum cinerariifolium TaxID=118510 RepID=A0A699IW95_TANCI|nr:hypothetical protein [Tanacetum cinerariifolium]
MGWLRERCRSGLGAVGCTGLSWDRSLNSGEIRREIGWVLLGQGYSRESLKAGVFVVHPGSVAARIKEMKSKTRKGSSWPYVKRKLASRPSSSRAAIVDNTVNMRACKFLYVIEKMSGEANVIKAKERSREEECEGLRVKCEAAMAEFDQNPAVLDLWENISSLTVDVKEHKEADKVRLDAVKASLRREVKELKKDRRDVVSKVVPYVTIELVYSDELGKLIGYRSSYQKDHTQARNDLDIATFPWLDEFVPDVTTMIETLLLKKPPMLQKHVPSRTQIHVPSSQKATPSFAPSLNLMSPPTDLVMPSPSLLE